VIFGAVRCAPTRALDHDHLEQGSERVLHAPSRVKPAAVMTSTRLIEPTDAPWQIADLSNHGKIAAVLPVLVRSRRADRLASDRDEFSERLVRLRGHRRPS
jgi:hypothetical protein